ncbi:MAG TPA: tRNA lysidine(34) synthetase TilS [Gemmatimonadales bacterium]|nr:tRNA lysidine(34) synthetase TilS [Gemmatimonadales bacterium]
MTLVARFASTIAQLRLPPGRAIVAVSGGVDSIVLLDLLAATRLEHRLELIVAHIDHGMQPVTAPRRIVEQAVARHGLSLQFRQLELGPEATETDARGARLAALTSIAEAVEARFVFLAHHADDQAETVLMRLLRGSGPVGLAGMARRRGRYLRPLLSFTRAELEEYARSSELEYWSDPTNRDRRHLRSWLRSEILPRLARGLPDVTARLLQAAAHARRDRDAWRAVVRDWPGLAWKRDPAASSVDLTVLAGMPQPLRLAVLSAVAREAGCPAGPARLAAAWRQVAPARSGMMADLVNGWRFEVAFDRLRLLAPRRHATHGDLELSGLQGSAEWGGWNLAWRMEPAPEEQQRQGAIAWFQPAPLVVRSPQPGDRLSPMGGPGRRLVVRCFQDAGIPSSERAGWPVIACAAGIAWIPRVCRSSHLLPVPGSPSLRLEVHSRV